MGGGEQKTHGGKKGNTEVKKKGKQANETAEETEKNRRTTTIRPSSIDSVFFLLLLFVFCFCFFFCVLLFIVLLLRAGAFISWFLLRRLLSRGLIGALK